MEQITNITANFVLESGTFTEVCRASFDKNYTRVNLKTQLVVTETLEPAYINLYVTNQGEDPSEANMIVNNLVVGLPEASPKIGDIYLGPNQSLYVLAYKDNKANINALVTGVTAYDPLVIACGQLASHKSDDVAGEFLVHSFVDDVVGLFQGSLTLCNIGMDITADEDTRSIYLLIQEGTTLDLPDTHPTPRENFISVANGLVKLTDHNETVFVTDLEMGFNTAVFISKGTIDTVVGVNGVVLKK